MPPGSSPRMRGAQTSMKCGGTACRIIPAYAGSTLRWIPPCSRWRDHPRVCGEHPSRRSHRHLRQGSSPRMRGALVQHLREDGHRGIIPAYAGSTKSRICQRRFKRDHPRVCGEHPSRAEPRVSRRGSSPRMRGARLISVFALLICGIIPAYAGSTASPSTPGGSSGDHPRVCGEHRNWRKGLNPRWGSSPRMRGAHDATQTCRRCLGIIPAYAGSTSRGCCGQPQGGDHPRVCGEHTTSALVAYASAGSSPRMRGALHRPVHRPRHPGIIPAYAGSTGDREDKDGQGGDHPRVCGEHKTTWEHAVDYPGSSPRMRGAPSRSSQE